MELIIGIKFNLVIFASKAEVNLGFIQNIVLANALSRSKGPIGKPPIDVGQNGGVQLIFS